MHDDAEELAAERMHRWFARYRAVLAAHRRLPTPNPALTPAEQVRRVLGYDPRDLRQDPGDEQDPT